MGKRYTDPGGQLGPTGWTIHPSRSHGLYDEGLQDASEMLETGGWSDRETGGLQLVAVAVDEHNGRRHPDLLATLRHPLIADGDRVLRLSLGRNGTERGQLWLWGLESCAYPPELRPIRSLPRPHEDGPGMRLHHPSSRECSDHETVRDYLFRGLSTLLHVRYWSAQGHRANRLEYRPPTSTSPGAYRVYFARDGGDRVLQVTLQEPDGQPMAAGDALEDFQDNVPLMLSNGFIAGLPGRS